MPALSEEEKRLHDLQVEYVLARRKKDRGVPGDHKHRPLHEIVQLACKLGRHDYCRKNAACKRSEAC